MKYFYNFLFFLFFCLTINCVVITYAEKLNVDSIAQFKLKDQNIADLNVENKNNLAQNNISFHFIKNIKQDMPTVTAKLPKLVWKENRKIKEKKDQNKQDLDTITVTGQRFKNPDFLLPASISKIDLDSPGLIGASDFSDILKDQPWVSIKGSLRRNGQGAVIRGFNDTGTVILLDGIRQNSGFAHDGRFFIDPLLLKQTRLIRGSSSIQYGNGNAGGVIFFDTKNIDDLLKNKKNIGVLSSIGYQSVNHEKYSMGALFGKKDSLKFLASISARESTDIQLPVENLFIPVDEQILSGLIKLDWEFKPFHQFGLKAMQYQGKFVEPYNPQTFESSKNGEVNKKIDSYLISARYQFDNDMFPFFKPDLKFFYAKTLLEKNNYYAWGHFKDKSLFNRSMETYGMKFDSTSQLIDTKRVESHLNYGMDLYYERQRAKLRHEINRPFVEYDGVPNADARYEGFYLENEIKLKHPEYGVFSIKPGMRFDSYYLKQKKNEVEYKGIITPKLALSYYPVKNIVLFANLSDSFRAPSLSDIYATGIHFKYGPMGVNNFIPNKNLQPEQSRSFEIGGGVEHSGIFMHGDELKLKLSSYWTKASDYIHKEVKTEITWYLKHIGTTKSVNLDDVTIEGSEGEISYENHRLHITAACSYVTGINEKTGKWINYAAPLKLVTNLMLKLTEINAKLGWRMSVADVHDQISEGSGYRQDPYRKGYHVHDAYMEWIPEIYQQKLKLNLTLQNIFNTRYQRLYPHTMEPGFNVKLQLSYHW